MTKKISIDPITRLEGHGKIDIFLDESGNVERAFLQVPELRGFEKFCQGRAAEEMPQITSRICGVCPGAHHMASTKALDALYQVEAPLTARLIRELYYNLHMFEDHTLHFYILAGPDFIVGPDCERSKRNILGVIDAVGVETGKKVISMRKWARSFMEEVGGKIIHPVFGLPGGISKRFPAGKSEELKKFADEAIEFARFTLQTFEEMVIKNQTYLELIKSDIYYHETYYMGMVDENNKVTLYDGDIRVVTPEGKELLKFKARDYADIIGEHVESWSYMKFPFLKKIGWKGFTDGPDSGIYRVAPLSRLNAADGMATKLAQAEYEKMYDFFGTKPVHHTLGIHWARLVEVLFAAERIKEIAYDPALTGDKIRNLNFGLPSEGIGIVEAPRGTLIHHYRSDEKGVLTGCNLIVASLGNSAAMCMSVERAAKKLIKNGEVNDGLLNMVEMAFRSYDPCLGCATHSLPGKMPLVVNFKNRRGEVTGKLVRNSNGKEMYIK